MCITPVTLIGIPRASVFSLGAIVVRSVERDFKSEFLRQDA